jgi:hypothetical protein
VIFGSFIQFFYDNIMAIEKPGARQSLQSDINGHGAQKRQGNGYEKGQGAIKVKAGIAPCQKVVVRSLHVHICKLSRVNEYMYIFVFLNSVVNEYMYIFVFLNSVVPVFNEYMYIFVFLNSVESMNTCTYLYF